MRKIENSRGNLTPIEELVDVPFEIKRVYYLYDVPGGSTRAGHAHKNLHQLLIAISGSFIVSLDDGATREQHQLTLPDEGLYLAPMVWRDIDRFSSGAVCLVLASDHYDENDYHRDYDQFLAACGSNER